MFLPVSGFRPHLAVARFGNQEDAGGCTVREDGPGAARFAALTTRYVADPETLARAGVTGVNFALSMTAPLLDRLAARVAAGSMVPPRITRVSLDDVPALLGHRTEGKTVIRM